MMYTLYKAVTPCYCSMLGALGRVVIFEACCRLQFIIIHTVDWIKNVCSTPSKACLFKVFVLYLKTDKRAHFDLITTVIVFDLITTVSLLAAVFWLETRDNRCVTVSVPSPRLNLIFTWQQKGSFIFFWRWMIVVKWIWFALLINWLCLHWVCVHGGIWRAVSVKTFRLRPSLRVLRGRYLSHGLLLSTVIQCVNCQSMAVAVFIEIPHFSVPLLWKCMPLKY